VPVNTILIDPDDSSRLYIGTDIGIFASFDGGITWLPDSNPIANVIVMHLTLDRAGDTKYLYAFTYGRGLWRVALAGGSGACAYSVSPLSVQVPAAGLTGSVSVAAAGNCPWSAVPTLDGNIVMQSPAQGLGNGATFFTVLPNIVTTPVTTSFTV